MVSASPRRRELLARLRIPFDICPSGVSERWTAPDASALAVLNARRKVEGSVLYGSRSHLLLGADTIISFGDRIFGKPIGEVSARRMLTALSGRTHQVITGVCLSGPAADREDPCFSVAEAAVSHVRFRPLEKSEIDSYLASGEWDGKAGAYAIQESGHGLVESLDGDFNNVVGLPVTLIHDLLEQHFSHCRFL